MTHDPSDGAPPSAEDGPKAEATSADERPAASAALSRELGDFLIQFSIAVHRFAMYPPGHPSLEPAADNVLSRLTKLFKDRPSLSIGVAHRQLVIGGVATESKNPVLSDLAGRLHEHQIGAISFEKCPDLYAIESLLNTLARDPDAEGQALGMLGARMPSWEKVSLYGLGYEKLELIDGEAGQTAHDKASQLWLGLARAAMAGGEESEEDSSQEPEVIAATIRAHRQEDAYDQVIVGYLLQLADELKAGDEAGESLKVRRQLSTLVNELDDDTLGRLIDMGGDATQRRQFLLDTSQALAVDSVVKIVKAAAAAKEQTISHSLTRLLTKLAIHAERGPGAIPAHADSALRENVEDLIEDWELTDPNPDSYTLILDKMAHAAPVFIQDEGEDEDELSGAARLLQMAAEVDAWGPTTHRAVSELIDEGQVSWVIALIDDTPPDSQVGRTIESLITSPEHLRRILSADDVDAEALAELVSRGGHTTIDPLLDALADSSSRSVRRKVFDTLKALKDESAAELFVARLDDSRWFMLRNILALIHESGVTPAGFSVAPFMEHADDRVRREAFPLAMKEAGFRERALAAALAAEDDRMVRMALLELRTSLPETLVPTLVKRVLTADRSGDLKAIAARLLASTGSKLALDAMLGLVVTGKNFVGRRKLAPSSPEVIATLQALAAGWPTEPRVKKVLAAARRSKDEDIRNAVSMEATS